MLRGASRSASSYESFMSRAVLVAGFLDPARRGAVVVHEDVDATEVTRCAAHEVLCVLAAREVGRDREHLAAGRAVDIVGRRLERVLAARADGDVHALAR